MSSIIEVGFKINFLTVISQVKGAIYLWRCDCSIEFEEKGWRILSGHKRTCGHQCVIRRKIKTERKLIHGDSIRGTLHNPRYIGWLNMRARCTNENNKSYPYYGGRGIAVCLKWLQSYSDFVGDMGSPPEYDYATYQLDRINVDGNYEPGNLRWATRLEQSRNKRNTVRFSLDGKIVIAAEEAEKAGIKPKTLIWRIRSGISPDRALNDPLGRKQIEQARKRDAILVQALESGRFKIYGDGRIIDLKAGKAIKPTSNKDGYLKVKMPGISQVLRQPNLSVIYSHHRVVALVHVPNPDPDKRTIVGHMNHNRADNRADNLAWLTPQENALVRSSGNELPSEEVLDYFSDDTYMDLLSHRLRPENPPTYTDLLPRAIRDAVQTGKLWSAIKRQRWFEGSLFDVCGDIGEQILGAPSNEVEISGGKFTICVQAMDGRIKRIPLCALKRTHRVFWGCAQCGYEEPARVEVRERSGDRGPKGNPCRICRSLALISPELDQLRRPDPVSHDFPSGLNLPGRKQGISAYFYCGSCRREIPNARRVKQLVQRSSLPICETCRSRVRNFNG